MTPNICLTSYAPQDYNIFIGLDVDKNSFSFTVKDHTTMQRSKKIPSQPEALYNYIQNNYPNQKVICAYEAGPTGLHLHDYLTDKQLPCLVVPPISIPHAPNERVKNNRIDSIKIAEELRCGKLKFIRVPPEAYRELRHLVGIREQYAQSRRAAKQRIKALLLCAYLYPSLKDIEQNWSNHYIKQLQQIDCSFAVRQRLDMLLMDLDYARKQTLLILRQLKTFCEQHPGINQYMKYLDSIPGIGFITAVTVLARIGDPQYLKNPRELAAFIGLVPREHSTGDHVFRGSITHLGCRTLRSLLVEAAWVAIRHNVQLKEFYCRIRNKHHPLVGSNKAIVAVARKLTQIIYRVLKEQRMYMAH